MERPAADEIVWIEYPEGKRFQARFDAAADTFVADGVTVRLSNVANWSRSEHEDYDISDDPKQQLGGRLARDQ